MRRFNLAAVVVVAGALLFSASSANAQCLASSGSNSARSSSWVAGAHAGYNWQQNAFVYGLETDLSGTGLDSSMSGGLTSALPCTGDSANTSSKIPWYGTVRGRAGWTNGNVLFYGTGGLAYGKVDLSSTFNSGGLSTSASTSSTRAGWVIGGGLEYMLRPDVFLNLGYQYVDLGTASVASSNLAISQIASAHAAFHVATIGLSWRFAPSDRSPKSWEGMYVGAHVGGAWGNSTDATYTAF